VVADLLLKADSLYFLPLLVQAAVLEVLILVQQAVDQEDLVVQVAVLARVEVALVALAIFQQLHLLKVTMVA